jgi:aspartyl/asparaginyl beta-hydroxylase (cupin superfamily)
MVLCRNAVWRIDGFHIAANNAVNTEKNVQTIQEKKNALITVLQMLLQIKVHIYTAAFQRVHLKY